MLIATPDIWKTAEESHLAYVREAIGSWLSTGTATPWTNAHTAFAEFVTQNCDRIAIGSPDELLELINIADGLMELDRPKEYPSLLKSIKPKVDLKTLKAKQISWRIFMDTARSVFDYEKFSKKNSGTWDAYSLCSKSQVRICPYCHQAYAFTVFKGKNGAFRPTLDHFYPKSIHPYLALSLYNLVPSCYSCNSGLKKDRDFHRHPHLHPFKDKPKIKFVVDTDRLLARKNNQASDLTVAAVAPTGCAASQASCDTFCLTERYAPNSHELTRLVDALYHWTPDAIAEFARDQGMSAETAACILLQFDVSKFGNEMLGKMKKDVMEAVHATCLPNGKTAISTPLAATLENV